MKQPITGAILILLAASTDALAWGDEAHKVVALIAKSFLEPDVREQVDALLASDTDTLTAHDIASEATWADRYKDAQTRSWHFVNIEIDAPNLDQACFSHPVLPPGIVASNGPATACITDKDPSVHG
jgi:hypothetical protein